jgi:alkanesulfonate monooxygenase SsuD/methylene tetrahydromethanopterin reductase-like flavin-dependent oxidoreductase (luciferase family)
MDPHSSHDDIGAKYALYCDALATNGHDVEGRVTPMARLVAVARTDDEAAEVARRGATWTLDSYMRKDAHAQGLLGATKDPVERYVRDVIVHGRPARVVDELARLREEIDLHYLLAAPLSHESFLLLTDEVIPQLS